MHDQIGLKLIPEGPANELIQTLADLLSESQHQIWHATQDPENFNRETAWKAYLEIQARAHSALEKAFKADVER